MSKRAFGVTARRDLQWQIRTEPKEFSYLGGPDGASVLSRSENFIFSGISRGVHRPPGADGMYRTWAKGGGPPSPKTKAGGAKTVAWRGKVRFLAVAEKARCKQLLSKQNSFCAPTQLKDCKDIAVWDSNILCPKVVQAMTHLPCFFG